jgi:hypothetical protein
MNLSKNLFYQSTSIISTAGINLPKATTAISKDAAAISKAIAAISKAPTAISKAPTAISKAPTAISRATAAAHCNRRCRHISQLRSRHHSFLAITAVLRIITTIITATNASF